MEYAKNFNITCEIVSGVTSAIAAPASVDIPITSRGFSESFWVITGTTKKGELQRDIELAAQSETRKIRNADGNYPKWYSKKCKISSRYGFNHYQKVDFRKHSQSSGHWAGEILAEELQICSCPQHCSKGMNLHYTVNDTSDRLLYPEMRFNRNMPLQRVNWGTGMGCGSCRPEIRIILENALKETLVEA